MPAILELRRLSAIRDEVILRDARGRSARPALAPLAARGVGSLAARGPFTVLQRFSVAPAEGAMFAAATGDGNPIHTDGQVIPGALLAARALLLPEILFAGARISRARVRFRAFSYYGLPATAVYRGQPAAGGSWRLDFHVRQRGMEVSEGHVLVEIDEASRADPSLAASVATSFSPSFATAFSPSVATAPSAAPAGALLPPGVTAGELARVRDFYASLRVDPSRYLDAPAAAYPKAYLAALPSGEMVRRFGGEGGLLNSLDLEFLEAPPALLESGRPRVEIEAVTRSRKPFHKVFTRIAEGVRTFCSGCALVLMPA